jgi:hypothetical protein
MAEVITKIDNNTGKPITKEQAALPGFRYENGYRFEGTDLGRSGVKIELFHEYERGGAIILPPHKAQECGEWLLQTLGQASHSLSKELPDILKRIIKQKGLDQVLERGDKKKIKDAIKTLKKQQSKN